MIENNLGFVYLITNKKTGKKYIGKKLFLSSKKKKIKGRIRRVKEESDWKKYWSSSKELHSDIETLGEDSFHREILHLCETKGELSYMEILEQFVSQAILTDDFYNGIVNVRIHKSHIKNRDKLLKYKVTITKVE